MVLANTVVVIDVICNVLMTSQSIIQCIEIVTLTRKRSFIHGHIHDVSYKNTYSPYYKQQYNTIIFNMQIDNDLAICIFVIPYHIVDLVGRHWLKYWGIIKQRWVITQTMFDLLSIRSSLLHLCACEQI